MADKVYEVLKLLAEPQPQEPRIWPALIGPSGAGKTTRVQRLAQELGRPLFTLLLDTGLPEDFLGIPRYHRDPELGVLVTDWAVPRWAALAAKEPVVLFLDEIDKAIRTKDKISALLTLLYSLKVRDIQLHPETIIVLAGQELPDPAGFAAHPDGEALAARVCWVPVCQDWDYVSQSTGLNLKHWPAGGVKASELPVLPHPSTRTVEWAVRWLDRHINPASDDERRVAREILLGCLPPQFLDDLLELWATSRQGGYLSRAASPEELVKALAGRPELVKEADIPTLVSIAGYIWVYGTPELLRDVLIRVWVDGNEEDAAAFLKTQYEYLKSRIEEAGGELEVFGDTPDDVVRARLLEAYDAIARAWLARGEKKGKEGR